MEPLIIEPTNDTPGIVLNDSTESFEISGRSLPEDVQKFYTPVLNWLGEYLKNPNPETTFKMKLDYFNSASSKMIAEILQMIESAVETGKNITIAWYHKEKDEDMLEAGEEMEETFKIPFNYIVLNK